MTVVESLIRANFKLAMFFIRQLSIDLGIADERTVNLTQKHIRGRLAESLLFLKDNYRLEKDGATINSSAIICFKEKAVQELDAEMGKNVYLNLYRHYEKAQSSDQTPNTPNVNLFWALEAAIDGILSEGLDHRIERYRRCASVLREGIKKDRRAHV